MLIDDAPMFDALLRGAVLAFVGIVWVVVLIRINGLRSLSKMTNFDFIMTVALGSLLASAAGAGDWIGFVQPLAGMVGLFVAQNVAARLRKTSDAVEAAMQNEPVLLMKDGEICEAALRSERVAQSDLIAKLREANALDLSKVKAVVLETTGDVSVLHGDETIDDRLLEGVRDKTQ